MSTHTYTFPFSPYSFDTEAVSQPARLAATLAHSLLVFIYALIAGCVFCFGWNGKVKLRDTWWRPVLLWVNYFGQIIALFWQEKQKTVQIVCFKKILKFFSFHLTFFYLKEKMIFKFSTPPPRPILKIFPLSIPSIFGKFHKFFSYSFFFFFI